MLCWIRSKSTIETSLWNQLRHFFFIQVRSLTNFHCSRILRCPSFCWCFENLLKVIKPFLTACTFPDSCFFFFFAVMKWFPLILTTAKFPFRVHLWKLTHFYPMSPFYFCPIQTFSKYLMCHFSTWPILVKLKVNLTFAMLYAIWYQFVQFKKREA